MANPNPESISLNFLVFYFSTKYSMKNELGFNILKFHFYMNCYKGLIAVRSCPQINTRDFTFIR